MDQDNFYLVLLVIGLIAFLPIWIWPLCKAADDSVSLLLKDNTSRLTKQLGVQNHENRIIDTVGFALAIFICFKCYSQSMADAARAERAAWAAGDQNANILNILVSSSNSFGASSSQQTVNKAQNQTENQTAATQPIVTNATVPKQSESIPVSGNWSLKIADNDNTSRIATLTIFQNGNIIFGKGNVNLGNKSITTTACGSASGNKLNIGLVTLEEMELYQLSMTVNGNSAVGSYALFTSMGSTSTGTVKGVRSSPS